MKRLLLLFTLFFFFIYFGFSQVTVKGKTIDCNSGEPWIGVSVFGLGTNIGTLTDIDGKFEFVLPDSVKQVAFSYGQYEGYDIFEVQLYIEYRIGCKTIYDYGLKPLPLLSKENELSELTIERTRSRNTDLPYSVYPNYYSWDILSEKPAGIKVIEDPFNFINPINTTHPYQSIQNKLPGLLITRPGGNPNEPFRARFRGLTTLGDARDQPIAIIDGIPNVDVELLDANDLYHVGLRRHPESASRYGLQAASGVLDIDTWQHQDQGIHLTYRAALSTSAVSDQLPVADRSRYLQFPNRNDLGSDTDWMDEITRAALSQHHFLSLVGRSRQTDYQINTTYRDVEGTLLNSGFQRWNVSAQIRQRAFKDKLTIEASWRSMSQESQLSFPRALQDALGQNPTAPIFDENSADTDGYFHQAVFDLFNPVALLEQNQNDETVVRHLGSLSLQWDWTEQWQTSVRYGQFSRSQNEQFYFDRNSPFGGQWRDGFAEQERYTFDNQYLSTNTRYLLKTTNWQFKGQLGYDFQQYDAQGYGVSAGNFITDAFTYDNLGASLDVPNGRATAFSTQSRQRLVSFWSDWMLRYKAFTLDANIQRAGASHLSENAKWNWLGGTQLTVDLDHYLSIPILSHTQIGAAWARLGNIPLQNGLSQQRIRPSVTSFQNGNYRPSYSIFTAANPDLGIESTRNLELFARTAVLNNKLRFDIHYFQTQANDLIRETRTPLPEFLSIWKNVGELESKGIEVQLKYDWLDRENTAARTGIILSHVNTTLLEYDGTDEIYRFPFPSPGCCSGIVEVSDGTPTGTIIAPVFEGVAGGELQLEDQNGNGFIDWEDYVAVGNGLPDVTIGLEQQISWGRFDLDFFLRGVFGHQMVNVARVFFENKNLAATYNVVTTEYYNEALEDFNRFNSYHVENASFLRLEYLTLCYRLPLKEDRELCFFLNTQNLFTLTNYTGATPEVRPTNAYNSLGINGTTYPNLFVTGIDDRRTYLPIRSWTFGVQVDF
ncbi:MAG: TonB-dependent receptor [Bacteroidota bacterium]